MESLINTISSNPVYTAILIIFSILLVYAFVKKIIKLVFVVGILLIVYAVYSNSVGKNAPKNIDELRESVSKEVSKVKEATSESINEVKQSTRKIVEEKVEEKLDQLLGD